MGRPSLLTPEVHRSVVAAVRAGSFAWIAAEANGIDRTTFATWMRRGEREQTGQYFTFFMDVRTARAQARLSAEIEVRKSGAFNWLRFGPGREREDAPGWTETKEIKHSGSVSIVQSTEWLRIAGALEVALKPFPEARLAVAAALRELQPADAGVDDAAHDEDGSESDEDFATPFGATGSAVAGRGLGATNGPDLRLPGPTRAPELPGRGNLPQAGAGQ